MNEYQELLEEIREKASSLAERTISLDEVKATFHGLVYIQEEEINGKPNRWSFGVWDEEQGVGDSSGLLESREECLWVLAQGVVDGQSPPSQDLPVFSVPSIPMGLPGSIW